MERYLWKARIRDGKRDEYIRRHDEIWPEMLETLKAAGISNYSIWLDEDDSLTGYYECESIAFATQYQNASDVVRRWDEYMRDVLVFEGAPNGQEQSNRVVFFMQ